jgi:hypothetical protein
LLGRVLQNINDFDYIAYLNLEGIDDPSLYYDVNRVIKLKDKLTQQVGQVLTKVI